MRCDIFLERMIVVDSIIIRLKSKCYWDVRKLRGEMGSR